MDGAQPRNFLKNRTIWHYLENISTKYFEMVFHVKLLNLKTFKDFSFMQNQRLLKDIWKALIFLKTSIKIEP